MSETLAAQLGICTPSPEQALLMPETAKQGCEIWLKRDDLLHPVISGNKWRKLQPQLTQILTSGARGVISFGGGHSNHLHALGYCCQQLALPFVAIVRGDYHANPTPTLRDLHCWQTNIQYVSKIEYRRRNEPAFLDTLQNQFPGYHIIPEGGSTALALRGVAGITTELTKTYDVVLAPVASGATLAGLIKAFAGTATHVLGIAVLNAEGYLTEQVTRFLPNDEAQAHWSICHDYHFGGYAKAPQALLSFCQHWQQYTEVPVEPVYSGKLFYALNDLLCKGYFPYGARLLALHTGGLQGART